MPLRSCNAATRSIWPNCWRGTTSRLPRTMLVQHDNVDQRDPALGLPCVLKRPDGAFSRGIVKAETPAALQAARAIAAAVGSDPGAGIHADRIRLAHRRAGPAPLFACKYYMVPGHWQIIKNDRQDLSEGKTEAVPIAAAPAARGAHRAAGRQPDRRRLLRRRYQAGRRRTATSWKSTTIRTSTPAMRTHVLQDALYREVMSGIPHSASMPASRNRSRCTAMNPPPPYPLFSGLRHRTRIHDRGRAHGLDVLPIAER